MSERGEVRRGFSQRTARRRTHRLPLVDSNNGSANRDEGQRHAVVGHMTMKDTAKYELVKPGVSIPKHRVDAFWLPREAGGLLGHEGVQSVIAEAHCFSG